MTQQFIRKMTHPMSNYRSISLLSPQQSVWKCINTFSTSFETITPSGFVPGDSTVNLLIDIYNTFCKALDEGRMFALYFVI